jgi:hypothetical protein
MDLNIYKSFVPKEGMRIEVRAETFNAFNHARFAPPNTAVPSLAGGNPLFGTITGDTVNGTVLENPRSFQFGLRFEF